MKRALLVLLLAGCDAKPAPPVEELPFMAIGALEYKERMTLPADVVRWNAKRVRASGYLNPDRETRALKRFYLVKDRSSCCFGKRPQLTHYIDVTLKPGRTIDYTTDPVSVEGLFVAEERWDGDWPLGLYWMTDAEVVK
jgi:hypothetical protein